jgi:Transposase, Mutator family
VLSYNSEPSVLIRKRECPEARRKAFIRKWRLKHCAVADSLEEAGDRLFTFTRLPPSQWRSARTTNAIERLHEEFKRRIKTQTVLPSADTAAMLFWALLIAESACAGDSSMPARKKLRNVILRPLIGAIFLKSGWNSGCEPTAPTETAPELGGNHLRLHGFARCINHDAIWHYRLLSPVSAGLSLKSASRAQLSLPERRLWGRGGLPDFGPNQNPATVTGLVNPGRGWGLRGAWRGQPLQGSTQVTLSTDLCSFLCHEQRPRPNETQPRVVGSLSPEKIAAASCTCCARTIAFALSRG